MIIDFAKPILWIIIGVILTNNITARGCATTLRPISVLLYPRASKISASRGINVPSLIPIN